MSNDPSKTKVDWTEVNNVKVINSIIDLTAKKNLNEVELSECVYHLAKIVKSLL